MSNNRRDRPTFRWLQSEWYPSHLWPNAIREAFYRKHMPYEPRFKVTIFFLANGMAPWMIKKLYAEKFNFDANAWNHINSMIAKYPTSDWTAWNISQGRSI